MNIRKSMYIKLTAVIASVFLLFSLVFLYLYNHKMEKMINDSLQAVAAAQTLTMTDFCKQQIKDLTMLGRMDATRHAIRGTSSKGSLGYLHDMLSTYVEMSDYLESTTILDKNFRVIACSEEEYLDYADSDFSGLAKKLEDNPFYISNVVVSTNRQEAQKVVVALTQIRDEDELLGYALAEINVDFYNMIREESDLWQNGTFYLLDGNTEIISAGTANDTREGFVTTKEERSDYQKQVKKINLQASPAGNFSYRIRGHRYVTYHSKVPYTQWLFLLTIDSDDYMSHNFFLGLCLSFLALLCLSLIIWTAIFTARRIILPIRNISGTLQQIQERQDYSFRVPVDCKDELGGLAIEINRLLHFIETEKLYELSQQRKLRKKAETDVLTHVLNRERINQYLQEIVTQYETDGGTFAVLFADIDDFKDFNTHYGHHTGDQVLKYFASLLCQETGGTVGRIGGDEFLIIIKDVESTDQLAACLDRINQRSAAEFINRKDGSLIPISCTIGAVKVCFPHPKPTGFGPLSVREYIDLADNAMYEAKNKGKHGYVIKEADVSM